MTLTSNKLEPAIWSRGTGQQIAWFDGCQLIITWRYISKTYKGNQGCMSLSTYYLELRNSTIAVAVAIVRTHPRAIPLAMITTRKSIHTFPLVSYMGMGLPLAALQAAGALISMLSLRGWTLGICGAFDFSDEFLVKIPTVRPQNLVKSDQISPGVRSII